jgi:hypothetical protein
MEIITEAELLGNASGALDVCERVCQDELVDIAVVDNIIATVHANFWVRRTIVASWKEVPRQLLRFLVGVRISHGDEVAIEIHLQETLGLGGVDDNTKLVRCSEGKLFRPDGFRLVFARVRIWSLDGGKCPARMRSF